jgi:hypothetical protein
MEEQRRRLRSANPAERLAAALLIPGALAKRLRLLRDYQIGQLLEDEVWSRLNLLAPESTVCLLAIERLRQTSRLRRFLGHKHSQRVLPHEGEHLLHAEAALYRARIPHLLLPFQRDKFASNVFMVPCAAEARHCLCQAGFRETPRSPSLLIDGETNRPIQLYEGKTNVFESLRRN